MLIARLALALLAETRHAWHRLTGGYDTAVYAGARLAPAEPPARPPPARPPAAYRASA